MKYDDEKSLGANAERIGLTVKYMHALGRSGWLELWRGGDLLVVSYSLDMAKTVAGLMKTACPECTKPTHRAPKLTPDSRTCDACGWLGEMSI